MSKTKIRVGHPTMKLKDLAPGRKAAFSPNLYAWMKEYAHFYREGGCAESVYRVRPGTKTAQYFGGTPLLIGMMCDAHDGDTDFMGMMLMSTLCNGKKAKRLCYLNLKHDLELIEDFWTKYLEVGRCAIDPEHAEHFVNTDRFATNDDIRTCLWCGAKHQRTRVPRIVHDETWVAV